MPAPSVNPSALREEWNKQKEMTNLKRVFATLDSDRNGLVGEKELQRALLRIGYKAKSSEIKNIVWQVDEDCDGFISWDEFIGMFHRCMNDETGLEPRELFQIVEFLMHDVDCGGTISQDELMEILFARFGKDKLLDKFKEFFPSSAPDGVEGEQVISFLEFRRFMQAIKPKRKQATVAKK